VDGPAIKGSAIQALVDDVERAASEGRVREEVLHARLAPADLDLLEEKVRPGGWYPIDCYRRLSELLLAVEGGGDPAYIAQRGARAAERLFASGLYDQLRTGEAHAQHVRERGGEWTESDGNLMATLAGVLFNFSYWRFEVADDDEPEDFRIEVTDARELPEMARLAAEGFIQHSAERLAQEPFEVRSERPSANHIVYTLTRRSQQAA